MKNRGLNPYLPSWEYVPDGEPHVFGDRVYVYGSHDRFNGYAFCLNDYVCWSAPITDLTDWRYEGVIYRRTDDPRNADGEHCLYAPDVTRGPDGRYYLYYALNGLSTISVAVCDTPGGLYTYYGNVQHMDGTLLGEREGDEFQFDPGVLTEGETTWLYTGFCPPMLAGRTGARVAALGPDMLTVVQEPVTVVPSSSHAAGTGFEGHAFFEASSIRKINSRYYFIYSSELSHELCYAVSERPDGPFDYGGILVSNGDLGLSDKAVAFLGNNHGSLEQIDGRWYVFYHRHTNGSSYCRQGCLEPIRILADGSIPQVEITSCGPAGRPLPARGEWPTYAACNLFLTNPPQLNEDYGMSPFPRITQDEADGGPESNQQPGYIANMTTGVTAGFKYFDLQNIRRVSVKVRGQCYGASLAVSLTPNGEPVGKIMVRPSNEWHWDGADIALPSGVHALYFKAEGYGALSFAAFRLE